MFPVQNVLLRNPVHIDVGVIAKSCMDFRRLCHIARRIFVVVTAVITDVFFRIVFKPVGNIFMEVYPVLPIQQKSPDSDQVCHITHIVCRIHFPVFCIIFQTLTHQLFHQMFGVLQAAVVRLQSDLFFLVLQKFCHKFFSDLFQRRPVPFIIIRNFQQFFPGNICFFKFLRQNSKFLQKLVLCQIHVNSSLSLSIQRTGFFFSERTPEKPGPAAF